MVLFLSVLRCSIIFNYTVDPANSFLLSAETSHTHIHFANSYRGQDIAHRYVARFTQAHAVLYDIECLIDECGRRVATFWYHAGYAGAAVALLAWSHQVVHPNTPVPSIPEYPSATALIADVKACVASALQHNGNQHPHILVMGVLGRSGSGAVDFCLAAGLPESNLMKWDVADTVCGGPFPEIAASDIFINCMWDFSIVPAFITFFSLTQPGRKLRVACEVSLDPENRNPLGYNKPMPIYRERSTFIQPTIPVHVQGDGPPLTVISIDNLPSLVAREASEAFSELLLPSLMTVDRREGVWARAERKFWYTIDLMREWNRVAELADLAMSEGYGLEEWDELSESDGLGEVEALDRMEASGEEEALDEFGKLSI